MDIFHKDGKISLAQAVNPGSFDLSNIDAISCPGLVVFMKIEPNKNLLGTFDIMIEAAKKISEELNGILYDDEHKPLTTIGIARLRAKILKISND